MIEDETGLALEPHHIGEVCVRAETIMLGYYNMIDNEESVFIDREGFFHTGDLGYYDTSGFVHITGKINKVIKWKYYHVSNLMMEQ